TPYLNSVPLSAQPAYPGDIDIEQRIENINRWNAMAMVLQQQDKGSGVGGHIATYGSAATLMEVGFNHFFRMEDESYGGDLVILQPHTAPGVYARAFLEDRLDQNTLQNYRRELAPGGGLPSYPHPLSLPDFWQVPNASMGLSVPTAIYQARFAKYLENRGLKPARGGKVWCFIGDGECDEPEVLGTINIAAREKLDNLILVVNCNLQRLDGPVRGNGKIIQELEAAFRGADWNVIKVIWGGGWDKLLAMDINGTLRSRMEECVDGDYQRYSVLPGDRQREHWVDGNAELEEMMNSLSDEEVRRIKRGGQDAEKIYAAYQLALQSSDRPTVLLIKTVKGDGMGPTAEGKNTVHQKKDLGPEERLECARNFDIPLDQESVFKAQFYKPANNSPEIEYLKARREALGGFVPQREDSCPALTTPKLETFASITGGSGDKSQSSTMAAVRLLSTLMKDPDLGKYIVPIVPDEARTFGLDALFRIAGIYSADGQKYTPVDADSIMAYREAINGQILQEGICETGAIASFLAAGTAYSIHRLPMIPFYFFYSIFGFQRVGDMLWSCGDMMCRGFLVGGTAGRTTLNGEGFQHQDGHSPILASTYPNLKIYDPAFGYELAVIVRDGIRRMYELQENIFYYLTVYNENIPMPAMPVDADQNRLERQIVNGAYLYSTRDPEPGSMAHAATVNLLGSGSIMQQALEAADLLVGLGFRVKIWSVTSYQELAREARSCERWNRLHPLDEQRVSYLEELFTEKNEVFIAVSDYMKALPESISRWLGPNYTVLGTDGYGLCESRNELREYFEINARHISQAALVGLYKNRSIKKSSLEKLLKTIDFDPDKADPAQR
ncbi:MAG: pyruvate dehydrogenase (acetyl-transferring), homodimeric type, partial [Gammaproteobacteria bacterium]|nr:pyruvate dehydrogenase (acetyl-transferring), homodimeric type [Gammaproteobacteria bacterium]